MTARDLIARDLIARGLIARGLIARGLIARGLIARGLIARGLIAHGSPQRLPERAAPSLVRALRDARGSPPWTPWTIRSQLDPPRYADATYAYVGDAARRHHHAGRSRP
jgi:hypothetical protein